MPSATGCSSCRELHGRSLPLSVPAASGEATGATTVRRDTVQLPRDDPISTALLAAATPDYQRDAGLRPGQYL